MKPSQIVPSCLALAGLVLALACEQQLDPAAPALSVVSVSIAPQADTLAVGDSVQLVATVVMSGNQAPHAVTWSSSNASVATVSGAGMARAVSSGAALVFAVSANRKDSMSLTVVPKSGAQPQVASVAVSPSSAGVAVGQTVQLTATTLDSAGGVLTGQAISWASSDGAVATVNGSGLVTGVATGTATISATSGGKTGTASVTVSTATPPPSTAWPNEPAGFTTLTDWSYDQLVTSATGSFTSGGNVWNETPGTGLAAIVSDVNAPFSPLNVAQITYPIGLPSGTEPWTLYFDPAPTGREFYTAFWWKASSSWQGDPSGINKITFWQDGASGSTANLIVMMNNQNQAAYLLTVTLEFNVAANGQLANSWGSGTVWHTAGNVNGGNYVIVPGNWYRVELYFKGSTTPTSQDGILRYWITKQGDAAPTSVGDYTTVNFDTPNFVQFEFAPTWGGNSGVTKTETDYYWFDHVHISTR